MSAPVHRSHTSPAEGGAALSLMGTRMTKFTQTLVFLAKEVVLIAMVPQVSAKPCGRVCKSAGILSSCLLWCSLCPGSLASQRYRVWMITENYSPHPSTFVSHLCLTVTEYLNWPAYREGRLIPTHDFWCQSRVAWACCLGLWQGSRLWQECVVKASFSTHGGWKMEKSSYLSMSPPQLTSFQ